MRPNISTIELLLANDVLASSIVPQSIGLTNQSTNQFEYPLAAGDNIMWELCANFTLGATGGFRFLANAPAAPTAYNAQFFIVDLTTPATFNFGQSVEAAVANASAVAGLYNLRAFGCVRNGANAGNFAFQFAQNTSDVLPITILAGAWLKVWQAA